MKKSEKLSNLSKISQYLNNYPRAPVKDILRYCQTSNILRSNDAVYHALQYMERNRIILNGCILVKNCEDYRNVHCLIHARDKDQFMKSIVEENLEAIEAVYQSRHGKENIAYVKSTKMLFLRDFELVEEVEWKNYTVIFPWKWDGTDNFLLKVPDMEPEESPSPRENLRSNPDFGMTEDIKTLYYWYKINVRLPGVSIMKETRFNQKKVQKLRDNLFTNSLVYFPTFLLGGTQYDCVYFSFFTKYYSFFVKLFAENSGTSFLIHGKNGRTVLFVNTTRPSWVLRTMEYFEDTGIIHNMLFYYLQRRWDPIIENFKLGRIPEKYFWMFGVPKK